MRFRHALMWLALAVLVSSCVVSTTQVELLVPSDVVGTSVESPLKAFLTDGRTTVFPDGVRITTDSVFGTGTLYSLDLASVGPIGALALDDLLGLESIRADVYFIPTVGYNAIAVYAVLCMIGIACSDG